ncbi:MAG: hypothetical protein WD044_13875, partial [Dongiaceae bacterium]
KKALAPAAEEAVLNPGRVSEVLRILFSNQQRLLIYGNRQRRLGKPVMALNYEALQADFAGSWDRLLRFLELPAISADTIELTLARQRDATSERLMKEYLTQLRDSDPFGAFDGG